MNRVGELHRRGPLGEFENAALGGEDVDLVGEQVDFEVLDELEGVPRPLLQLQKPLNPFPGPRLTWAVLVGLV